MGNETTRDRAARVTDGATGKPAGRRRRGAVGARSVRVGGARSVRVGGDATGNLIVTGDHNVIQRYPALRDALIDFRSVLADGAGFVGREAWFRRLETFQAQRERGYFCIEAQAGLGKTALAAEVARRYGAPSFFASALGGPTEPARCLNHLSVELIVRYELEHDHLPDGAGRDSAFLSGLLVEAVERRGGPLWLVVDGLDEADERPPGRNTLLLPDRLPRGVYVLLTYRPSGYAPTTQPDTPVEEHQIQVGDREQRAELEAYLWWRLREDRSLTAALRQAQPPIEPEQLVARLEETGEGNFKYLEYVLADLIAPEPGLAGLRLERLPRGLQGYYRRFWEQLEAVGGADWSLWNELHRPAIGLLAVAGEPIDESWLADLLGREPLEIRERVLLRWQRFLRRERGEPGERWRIVHQSFADFLRDERKVDLLAAHRRIASYYREDSARWGQYGGYAGRHLASHWRRAGERAALFELLAEPAWYAAQAVADPSEAAYLADVQQGWAEAEVVDAQATAQEQPAPLLAQELRCALAHASLRSRSQHTPPALLERLLASKLWTAGQTLAAAHQTLESSARAEALARLAPLLEEPARGEQLERALAATLQPAVYERPEGPRILALLAPHLTPPLLARALEIVRVIRTPKLLAFGLLALLPVLAGQERQRALEEAEAAAREIGLAAPRSWLLARLAREAGGDAELRLGEQARRTLEQAEQTDFPWLARRVAAVLAGDEPRARAALLEPVLAAALDGDVWNQQRWSVRVVKELAPYLSAAEQERVVERAAQAADQDQLGPDDQDWLWPVRALTILAPDLNARLASRALEAAATIGERAERAEALAALAPRLPLLQQREALRRALASSRFVGDLAELATAINDLAPDATTGLAGDSSRREALDQAQIEPDEAAERLLAGLADDSPLWRALGIEPADLVNVDAGAVWRRAAPGLSEPQLAELLQTIGGTFGGWRAAALTALAPYLPAGLFDQALELALVSLHQNKGEIDGYDRARALAALAPHLPDRLLARALTATCEIDYQTFRAWALAPLAERLAWLPPSQLYPRWQEALRRLAERARGELALDLASLRLVLLALGGETAAQEAAAAIRWAGERWE